MKTITEKTVIRLTQNNAVIVAPVSQKSQRVEVSLPVNHLIVIDCSGSMYSELPKIREQLKSKLPTLVKEQDSVSIIGFSGRGQCATLMSNTRINGLTDLVRVNSLIDRYLTPQGLTSFYEPLKAIDRIIDEINRTGEAYSVLFLTDGYDNQSTQKDLIKLAEALESKVTNAVFVEYGYYCNTALLNKLAESVGGQVIFSQNFKEYEPVFVNYITKNLTSGKKVSVKLDQAPKHGLVMSFADGEVTVYKVSETNEVLLPENLDSIYYLAEPKKVALTKGDTTVNWKKIPEEIYKPEAEEYIKHIYSILYVLMQRNLVDDVYDILGNVGDVELIQEFSNAIGKQSLARVQNKVLNVMKGDQVAYTKGYQANMVPKEDAFCILDLFELLSNDEEALWFPSHESFVYNAIGAKKTQASAKLTDEEVERVKALTEEMVNAKSSFQLNQLVKLAKEIQSNKFELRFEPKDPKKGHKIGSMVWNESRPNLSFMVRQEGTVALPDNEFKLNVVDTFRYRNYTFIKDGIVNVEKIAVEVSDDVLEVITVQAPELIAVHEYLDFSNDKAKHMLVLDLTKIPVINRKMVKKVSAEELFRNYFSLLTLKGFESVFNHYNKIYNPKVSNSFVAAYSPEAAAWLKEIGITDFNGFAPKVVDEKIGEVYTAKELVIKVKGLASLPTVKDVAAKYEAGKALTPREEVLRPALKAIEGFIETVENLSDDEISAAFAKWLETMKSGITQKKRQLSADIARTKFAIILGQTWFTEFETMDENHLLLDVDGRSYDFTVDMNDKEVEI